MKALFTAALAMLSLCAIAQFTLSGTVKDVKTGEPLSFATVSILNNSTVHADENGLFRMKNMEHGTYVIHVSYLGFISLNDTFALTKDLHMEYFLFPSEGRLLPTVQISAVKAKDKSGIAFTNLSRTELEKKNLGQDIPFLLSQTVSTVITSDAGNGIGYTGIRIRGSDATRTNVTINGIPVNDAESQQTYWVDFPDLISSVDNIQVQRGTGTSTNGAGAFGGSVNIETHKLNPLPYALVSSSAGSFKTLKNTVGFGTGLINEKFTFDGRLSLMDAGGYIDRSSAILKSYFLGGSYFGKRDVVKFITFSGTEETYQSWYGVHRDSLDKNRTVNIAGMYLDPQGRVNYYENQVDHYRQDYYQLHYSRLLSRRLTANLALHYTYGAGYYEEYRQGDSFSEYGLPDVITKGDTITATDLIRRKWLENDFYGAVFSLNLEERQRFSAIAGGAFHRYEGSHFGKIIWAQFASSSAIDGNYYSDDAVKNDANSFVKVSYRPGEKLDLTADLQVRTVVYSFTGYDETLKSADRREELIFFNPKAGVTYSISNEADVYLYYGVGNKEPNRDDYTQSTPGSKPRHETLSDLEMGYHHRLRDISWSTNLYLMNYKNQLVLTGEVNDVGAYNRSNVEKSYRAGVEAQAGFRFLKRFTLDINAAFSRNRIIDFTEYTDNYDAGGQDSTVFEETDIAFSPGVTAASGLSWEIVKGLSLSLASKYVGRQFLDNTSDPDRVIRAYLVNDLLLSWTISPGNIRAIQFKLLVNNILNEEYESNGYTYGYIFGGKRIQESYYYPQAGINFLCGVTVKF